MRRRGSPVPSELALPEVLAGVIAGSLNAYVLFGGADFGGGVWDLLARGPRTADQRALISDAIGPIWEANHVWLILAIVLTFSCFPPVFARLGTVLHIPLSLMLVGIVLRGSAFTFRTYDDEHDAVQRRWGRIFAGASLVTPVLLGVCIGAVASGHAGPVPTAGDFADRFVDPWLTPFSLAVGLMALALFAHLAAVFLTLEGPMELGVESIADFEPAPHGHRFADQRRTIVRGHDNRDGGRCHAASPGGPLAALAARSCRMIGASPAGSP